MSSRFPIKTRKELMNTAKNGNFEIFKIIVDSCKPRDNTDITSELDLCWLFTGEDATR